MSPSPDRRSDRRSDRRFDRGPDRRPQPGSAGPSFRPGAGGGSRPGSRGSAAARPRRPGGTYGREKPAYDRDERRGERPGVNPYGRRSYQGRPDADGPSPWRDGEGRQAGERRGGDRFPAPRPSFGRPGTGAPRPGSGRPTATRPGGARRGPAPFRESDRGPRFLQGRRSPDGPAPAGSATDVRAEGDVFAAAAPSDLIWGRHSCQATLESGRPIHRVWCTPEMRFSPRFLQLLREAKASGVLVEEVTWARLGQISGGAVHQGIVLQPAAAETLDLASLIEGCREIGEAPLLIAVDGLTDPQNLGAIVRSAEALGAHGMVLPQRRNAGLTGSVAKVAAGALEHLPVARVVNLNRSLEALKQEGYRVVGLAEEGTVSLEEADLEGPLVVVTGSEGDGLSLLTRRSCDQLVRIPLRGATPSLNASVATALLLYEVARRGWMRGLRGAAPAPRIVRPSMPAPPDPYPEDAETAAAVPPMEAEPAAAAAMAPEPQPADAAEAERPEVQPPPSEPAPPQAVAPAGEEPASPATGEPLPYSFAPPAGFDGDIRL
ncbi:MAG: hypothetical protein ER33_01230 [Cyanobium sp. CACIAM 14]|nr:MAG: hypothetical protein ER33_01230 [Cyanobium sp. CACIAM 14]